MHGRPACLDACLRARTPAACHRHTAASAVDDPESIFSDARRANTAAAAAAKVDAAGGAVGADEDHGLQYRPLVAGEGGEGGGALLLGDGAVQRQHRPLLLAPVRPQQ